MRFETTMKILGWHRLSKRRRSEQSSPLTAVLPRVRTIREQCDWLSSTTPASQEQRRERVLSARRRINYRPLPHDFVPESLVIPRKMYWLCFSGLVLFFTAVLWVLLTADPAQRPVIRQFHYQLATAPPFLSEEQAVLTAEEALSQVVRDPTVWRPVERRDQKGRTAPDGTRDVFLVRHDRYNPNAGWILFDSTQHVDTVWAVNLQLQATEVWCTVSKAK